MRSTILASSAVRGRVSFRVPLPRSGACGSLPRSNGIFRILLLALAACACSGVRASTPLPLQFAQDLTPYNVRSLRGMPISSVSNSPAGSDGRQPSISLVNESGTFYPATTNQFVGLITLGGGIGLSKADWQGITNSVNLKAGATAFNLVLAQEMKLPWGQAGSGSSDIVIQRQAQIGAPYLCRVPTCLFGSVIPVSETDEFVHQLPDGISPASYWQPEPYSTNGHANAGYYWSPNARVVYATQPGPVSITWKKAYPYQSGDALPAYTNLNGTVSFVTESGNTYLLYTARYLVSSSTVKKPRRIYWTEGAFQYFGKLVSLDKTRVPGGVKIVYNSGFPQTVGQPYTAPGEETATNTFSNPLTRLNTFYSDSLDGCLHANNAEGRVFMELLGDANADGSHQSLGFEIVDVLRQPMPVDMTAELGEQLLSPPGIAMETVSPELVNLTSFTYQQNVAGSDKIELYATQTTKGLNDCLVHWMETGEQGLKWPTLMARFDLVWPGDVAKYSHYIRPLVATEAEARLTAVPLSTKNVPQIAYQDPCDYPRAKLTTEYKFFTFLDAQFPAHRTLLQFNSGGAVAFERVFSWLDSNLRATNFAGSVAAELTDVVNYPAASSDYTNAVAQYTAYTNYLAQYDAYLVQYAAYTNYVATRSRGVNGNWSLYVTDDRNGDGGSIESWALLVDTLNPADGTTNTVAFAGAGVTVSAEGQTDAPYWTNAVPYPTSVTVSGITNTVTGVRVKLSGITHIRPSDLDVLLAGPRTTVACVMADAGGIFTGMINCTNTFSDLAYVAMPQNNSFNGATYRPTNYYDSPSESAPAGTVGPILTSLNALLLSAPLVADPGAAPVWLGTTPTPVADLRYWSDEFAAPRVVSQTVTVGDRIAAPAGEPGQGGAWAGHINVAQGDLYNPGAYVDPLASGFEAAQAGAIIPVNAVPGANRLEVWWFRANNPNAGHNAGSSQAGFETVYWPSVLGRYTLAWPKQPREIVLASNLGSGTLDTFEATGTVYGQNDKQLPGYNPNEEHALVSGGSAFALRDDLNSTNAATYSSHPFVLLDYTAQDGRPAMSAFRVLREKPEAGYVFDYIVPAGHLLQPPMPLPLMAKPVEGSGDSAVNYNTEPAFSSGDLPGAWDDVRDASGVYSNYSRFTWEDRKHGIWVYRGPHAAGIPELKVGCYDAQSGDILLLPADRTTWAPPNEAFQFTLHATRLESSLTLTVSCLADTAVPPWLGIRGLTLYGVPPESNGGHQYDFQLVVEDKYDHACVTNLLRMNIWANARGWADMEGSYFEVLDPEQQAPLSIVSTNTYTGSVTVFSSRPPFLAVSPTPTNSFTMRYYYKTEATFDWPNMPAPPATGSIVPYLRRLSSGGGYLGDGASNTCQSLDIVYRPVWPQDNVPTLPFGQTLAETKSELPGLRDWKSAQILYQQSVAANITNAQKSAVLFDPTREKVADLSSNGLSELPKGIASTVYQGKTYFPNLPPHLASRLFFDPNRSAKGSVVLQGEFKKETMGDSYFLLNVLRGSDLAAAKTLCPSNDTDYAAWGGLIDALAAQVETFHENPAVPGTYVADPSLTVPAGVGAIVEVGSANTMVDSYALSASGPGSGYITLVENSGTANTLPGDPVAMHIIKVGGSLYNGELKIMPSANPLSELVTFQHTADLAGRFDEFEYEWKIAAPVDGLPPATNAVMSRYLALTSGLDLPRYILGGAGIQALSDNYIVMRYRPKELAHPLYDQWSAWTSPALCEGWIKRVLAGINPFSQRISDLFNNAVNTEVSLLTQAGHRWEGDVALNADTLNNYGLIEIYETVLRRGRMLSVEAGYNYGPANDALLLACGYLNDLYMMVGNEAWADAANPTIGIGTKDTAYGDVATALFAFKGQTASLLDEELALLRGRDDFLQPGVAVSPVYNRLVWNYTRGIDAGEVIYALNYNIQEKPDVTADGIVNAQDAAYMFPQGHGDAYGHYLTALKGYYSLLVNNSFDWVPRAEAVNILGKPVSVDYQDERKFAAAAVALGRAGRQILDLTWRKDFQSVGSVGWAHLSATRANSQTQRTRYWGTDHWATRTGQGTYLNWVAGNAILPDVDPNPAHEGIQKVDRTTVPELSELTALATALQTDLDNAEGGLTPLGMPEGAIAFDIDPNVVVGTDNGTHFEQVYGRAKGALNNAVASFDDAKDVTRMMRAEQDSLADFQNQVSKQEQSYNNALIELYGTPYPDDIGAGKTYTQGFTGPDLFHYAYVDQPEYNDPNMGNYQTEFKVDTQQFPDDNTWNYTDWSANSNQNFEFVNGEHYVSFNIGPRGFLDKPTTWTGVRASPGKLQQDISGYLVAYNRLQQTLVDAEGAKASLDYSISMFNSDVSAHNDINALKLSEASMDQTLALAKYASEMITLYYDHTKNKITVSANLAQKGIPQSIITGLAMGGDLTSAARSLLANSGFVAEEVIDKAKIWEKAGIGSLEFLIENTKRWIDATGIAPIEWSTELRGKLTELANLLGEVQGQLVKVNQSVRDLDDAQRNYRASVAKGDRIQLERQTFRRRAAVVVQGYRTRDAGFRIFRNEKLERYKTLFDLSARYAFLAANAYDYETGLLNTDAGRSFINRIVSARALGVVKNGEPQYAGSDTGDPGLSSALAEMKADWDVLRGRLGFNNPDAYGTTVSLRWEGLRIRPGADGDANWKDLLQQSKMDNILDDSDVRKHCMQIDNGSGLSVPGIVLSFSTTVADGANLFGQELAAGDHAFSSSSFATKIFAVGVALEGYRGMDNPAANSGAGGTTPADPSTWYLDPLALSATPYVYLIPVGMDAMRSPPLGDASTVRTWTVNDVAIPMPFNIGASEFSTKSLWQSSESLTEPLFAVRKHQAFRPVSTTSVFSPSLYGANGTLLRSQYTNNRLVGRSVWNTQWKLVIPGKTLLSDPKAGLDRFIQTVKDAKLHFVTYSYSGN